MSIIRNGSNYGSISHFPKITDYGDDLKENEIMSAFLNQYYKNNEAPKLIIVNVIPEQKKLLEELFSKQEKHLVNIYKPLKGFKLKILNDLEKTAFQNLNKKLFQNTSNKKNLFNLSKLLNINEIKKIETYDNSHNHETNAIGAFITLVFLEILIKARFIFLRSKKPIILVRIFDMFRIGIAYGLFSEGLKLL